MYGVFEMPNIELSLSDLKKLVGPKLPADLEKLESYIWMLKSEIEAVDGDSITIKVGDTNRPDLWCIEGLARELRGALEIEKGLKEYSAKNSDYKIYVHAKLATIRPYIACVVVKNVKLTNELIKQIMQQQEKIDGTYGRKRAKTSIGLYKLDSLKWPLKYAVTKPNENAFVPLNFSESLTPKQILEKHPKGLEYQHLLKGLPEYPIFLDADGRVLSMPPIINSNDLGQVDETTNNILVEVTGTDYEAVNNVLRIMAMTFADRGGELHQVTIDYAVRKPDATPHFDTKHFEIKAEDVGRLLGERLPAELVARALQKARYSCLAENRGKTNVFPGQENSSGIFSGNIVHVTVPSYRTDIMHQVDIYEDVAIFHGFEKFKPEAVALPSVGKLSETEKVSRKVRELCIGTGAQEVMNFTLTNADFLFGHMNAPVEEVIEIENPVSFTFSVLRNSLLPSLMEFLSKNTTKEFPQKIFEVGDVVVVNHKSEVGSDTIRKLCFALSDTNANFTDAKQVLESVAKGMGWKLTYKELEHPSFIAGRCASVLRDGKEIGFIGELHPKVLGNWGLGMPVVGFELLVS